MSVYNNQKVYGELFSLHDASNDAENYVKLAERVGDLSSYERALDVGCGNGKYTRVLEKYCDDVIGIDIHPSAKQHVKHFLLADATSIPFPDNTFDLVLCVGVAHHNKHPVKILKECIRVLKPSGKMYFTVYRTSPYYTINKWIFRPLAKVIPFSFAKKLSFDVDNWYAEYVHTYTRKEIEYLFYCEDLIVEKYVKGVRQHNYTLSKGERE